MMELVGGNSATLAAYSFAMPLLFSALHRIGHEVDPPEDVSSHSNQPTASEYINELVESVVNSVNKRSYDFIRDEVEVSVAINQYHLATDAILYKQAANIIANRLHITEKKSRVQNANLINPIPKGVLIQAFLQDGVSKRVLVVKSDYDDFLDNTFMPRTGLPKKKKVYKAFLAELGLDGGVVELFVSDSSGGYSKYWWRDFLELREKRGDAQNTKTFWDSLEKDILNPIKRNNRADYEIIRNGMILYVKSNDRFELNDFVRATLENYEPQNPELPIASMVSDLRRLPVKRANNLFDTSFNIVKSEIKARSRTTYHITNDIDVVIKTGIENFKDAIQAVDENGIKYIKIRTDEEGFKIFARNANNESS